MSPSNAKQLNRGNLPGRSGLQMAGSYLTSPAVPRRGKRTRSEQRGRLPRRQRPRKRQKNPENSVKPKGRLPAVRLLTVPAGISPRLKREPRQWNSPWTREEGQS